MYFENPHSEALLMRAVDSVPEGSWAIGVSGGADSVALLSLLREKPSLRLHVSHLNHETRGAESEGDADFVRQLAAEYGIPCDICRLSEIAAELVHLPNNPSARYRVARFEMFRRLIQREHLDGVILAHHADDQAETILQRLLRGSSALGLQGIQPRLQIGELVVLHPLLTVPRRVLRDWLTQHRIAWREDASNESSRYFRNRLRKAIQPHAELRECLLELGAACTQWADALDQTAPHLAAAFPVLELDHLPDPLAHHAARRWLCERGADFTDIGAASTALLIQMARDAASPSRQHFPGALLVQRRRGIISAGSSTKENR